MRRRDPELARAGLAAACVLLVLLAASASGAPPENVPAAERARAPEKLGADLAKALEGPPSAAGIAVGVALRSDDLPRPGAARRAAIAARQQRALDALPAESFRLKRRYASVSGVAGWAQPAAIEALLAHAETELVYLDGTVRATLAQGSALVGAPSVHAQGFTGVGIRVAVLDSGIDTDHPHLSDDIAAQQCFCDDHPSPNFGCCPSGGQQEANAEDDEGHGTSTSGIITSSRTAGPGVAPDAEIIAVKVLDSGGSGAFSDIAAGLDWLITNHVSLGLDVVSMSLGDGTQQNNASVSPCSGSNTANAIQSLHGLGIPTFVSSGNEGHDNGIAFPACVAEAISVGGVYDANVGGISWCGNSNCTTILCTDNPTFADRFVCHTNSGSLLDILAPNFRTATAALGGGTNSSFGGTSASCPYAAAQAALLLEADPSLTPEQIRALMNTNGPSVTNPDNSLSFTRTDVNQVLQAIAPATCGNDVVETGEDCDDGNTVPGDCCSELCAFETAGSSCEDGDACSMSDTCDGSGACDPGTPLPCDDGQFCNGLETCDSGSGCVDGPDPVIDDGVACTDDSCDEAGDVVVNTPNPGLCDDGAFCNGAEICDPGMGGCVDGPDPVIDDGIACTDDSCDEAGDVVVNTPNPGLCDDADPCTAELCDVNEGCTSEPVEGCIPPAAIPSGPSGSRVVLSLILTGLGAAALRRRTRRSLS